MTLRLHKFFMGKSKCRHRVIYGIELCPIMIFLKISISIHYLVLLCHTSLASYFSMFSQYYIITASVFSLHDKVCLWEKNEFKRNNKLYESEKLDRV